ncbi:hypothetical protein GCM10023189_30590 [Nibrella saemangeumensis]|uniref:Uncharacterized protein n=1 Tax=Nibrella saemangeumensis TaxID=1084526 RepID=A0ABP8MYS0_9BACT
MEPTPTPPIYESAPARPQFLTILCVLTFLSCAWGIYDSIVTYATADTASSIAQEALDEAADRMQGREGAEFVERIMGTVQGSLSPENLRKSAISKLVYNLLTLLGAILMFNLRRVGYYAYLGGVIAGFLLPILLIGGLVGFASSTGVFFSIIFTILYGTQLKYMR